jgi:hypothetical protein
LIAWRGTRDPSAAVVVMPLAGIAVFRPPATLGVLHRDLLELRAELLGAQIAVVVLSLKVGIATVCFSKFDLYAPIVLIIVFCSPSWERRGLVWFRPLFAVQFTGCLG